MAFEKKLLDTSAWILSFKHDLDVSLADQIRQDILNDQVVTTKPVILELLVGCRTVKEQERLQLYMNNLEQLPLDQADWDKASVIGFTMRRQGVTIPTIDLVIASQAMNNHVHLIHCDKHYEMIASVFADLHQTGIMPC
jgi:predicted nucleic acid-binding protein